MIGDRRAGLGALLCVKRAIPRRDPQMAASTRHGGRAFEWGGSRLGGPPADPMQLTDSQKPEYWANPSSNQRPGRPEARERSSPWLCTQSKRAKSQTAHSVLRRCGGWDRDGLWGASGLLRDHFTIGRADGSSPHRFRRRAQLSSSARGRADRGHPARPHWPFRAPTPPNPGGRVTCVARRMSSIGVRIEGRRISVRYTPLMKLGDVVALALQEAKKKWDVGKCKLVYAKKTLDLKDPMRFLNIPQGECDVLIPPH